MLSRKGTPNSKQEGRRERRSRRLIVIVIQESEHSFSLGRLGPAPPLTQTDIGTLPCLIASGPHAVPSLAAAAAGPACSVARRRSSLAVLGRCCHGARSQCRGR